MEMHIMSDSKITIQITGTPLIKFQSAERIQQLRKSHIYAKTLGYYRKLEETTGDKEIGDGFEAMVHVNEAIIRFPDTGKEILLNDELISTSHSDDFVFACLASIRSWKTSYLQKNKKKKCYHSEILPS